VARYRIYGQPPIPGDARYVLTREGGLYPAGMEKGEKVAEGPLVELLKRLPPGEKVCIVDMLSRALFDYSYVEAGVLVKMIEKLGVTCARLAIDYKEGKLNL